MTLPAWLLKQLEDQGYIVGGATRAARLRRCPTCTTTVLAALDADTCARRVTADPLPLSPLGEALALIGGRATYALWYWGGRLELNHRTSFHIKGTPAGTTDRFDVVAEHRCGYPRLDSLPSVHRRTPTPPTGSEAPF